MFKIGFTGDFCPRLRIEKMLQNVDWKKSFDTVIPFFEENDLNVIDLECPLTTGTKTLVKTGPHISAHPQTVKLLSLLNCRLVATANNHFKDFGSEGIRDSYQALSKEGIKWVGSGSSYNEIRKIIVENIRDKRFAFINVTENEWSTIHDDGCGCNSLNLVNVYNDIKEVESKVDYIIVIVHGGHEHYNLPSPRIKKWYRFIVDAGANAVISHHTHTISGYEVYKESPIFYSLGNFCFDWPKMRDQPWNRGMLVRLVFEAGKPLSFDVKYVTQNNGDPGVKLITGEEEKKIKEKIMGLNAVIQDDEKLTNSFQEYVDSQKKITNSRLQPYTSNFLASLHLRGLLPSFIGTRKKRLLTNLIRCESHRDVLVESLKKYIT